MLRANNVTSRSPAIDIFETKARAVLEGVTHAEGLKALGEDRPFLDFIKELLKELLPIILGCFATPALAGKELRDPGPLTKVRLRFGIRRGLRDEETVNLLAGPLFKSTLAVMKTTTDAEVEEMAGAA